MRIAARVLGLLMLLLGFIGALVPLLPTTPFLLAAAACFARSAPHWNESLLRSPLFGRALREWQTHRTVNPITKIKAIALIAVGGFWALYGVKLPEPVAFATAGILCSCAVAILLLPTRQTTVVTRREGGTSLS